MTRFILMSMVLLVAGCSGLLHSEAPPVQIYVLRAAASPSRAAAEQAQALDTARAATSSTAASPLAASPPSLQVPRPQADPGLNTELIALVQSDHRMDRYAGSSWAANLQDVVETLAIDTLRASGTWSAVHDAPSPFSADYLLQINIRRFEADYTGGGEAPKVYVTLDCTIARRLGRELLTSFVSEGVADADANRMGSVVAAFEKAANVALADMAARSADAVRTSKVPSTP
ncbi:MAG: ABC-type transport auxiliary lipoprotein family protein [Gammaproteobacteria bacterium]